MELTRRVHARFSLEGGWKTPDLNHNLDALELRDLIQLVSLITSQYYRASFGCGIRAVDTTTRWLRRATKLKDAHRLLCKTMHVFRDWPNNFFAFLQWRACHLQSNVRATGVLRDFGELWNVLYRKPLLPAFDFVRDAFHTYLKGFWQGGHASLIRRLNCGQTRYVSKPQACKVLGAGSETVDRLIETGKLMPQTQSQGGRRLILISLVDLDLLKEQRRDLIDRLKTSERLGITTDQVQIFARTGLLTERKAYDLQTDRDVFYSITEIDALLQRTNASVKTVQFSSNTPSLGFAEALGSLARRYEINAAQFVKAILDGEIRPRHLTNELGLRALKFRRSDIIEYRDRVFGERYPDRLNTLQAAKALNVHPFLIHFLVRRKLLDGVIVRLRLTVSQTAISDFCSKYLVTLALAKQFGTSPRYLTNLLEIEGIEPVPESIVQKKPSYYVFNRSDLEGIKLDELIKAKRQVISLHSQLLDVPAAAQFLNTEPGVLSDFASNGVLRTWSSRTRQPPSQNCFTEAQLRRLIGKVESYIGLVTSRVAAEICERSVTIFNERFVNTNLLAVVHIEDDCRRLFRRTDVEKLAARLKNLIGAADVRARLKLGESQLIRLIASGELKPTSGPNVDGFGHNLFSKHDVEILRKQRESFKRGRARLGGSQRFGKPAGPQRSPVIEAITPRVKALVAEAAANGTFVSGAAIHKHLVKEGHKIGINSVYVSIRKARSPVHY